MFSTLDLTGSQTGLISDIYPGDRVGNLKNDDNGQLVLPIKNDGSYFDVTLPLLSFDNLDLSLELYRPESVSEVKLGIPRGANQHFAEVLLSQEYLDDLDWDYIADGDLLLWQKERKYESIDEFLNSPPQGEITAVHPTAPTPQLFLPSYQTNTSLKKLPTSLRGSHALFTYIKDEPLQFSFEKEEIGDPLPDEPKLARVLNFRGQEITKLDLSQNASYSFNIPNLDEGLYRIEFSLGESIVISNIETTLSKLVSKNQIWLYGFEGDVKIDFEGQNLSALANTDEALQEIIIDKKIFTLNTSQKREQIYQSFREVLDDGNAKITLQQGDVKLSGSGYFSFTELHQNFNPEPDYTFQLLPETEDEKFSEASFALARYMPNIENHGDYIINSYSAPINSLYADEDEIQFSIIIPGISKTCEEVDLKNISVTLKRPPLNFEAIKELIKKVL